ncbi:MAG: hypothetical protein JW889_15155 [Verrucomicrobia bacterium]|nr:hypothetical protein [Verrucomicrobiota bacterium]
MAGCFWKKPKVLIPIIAIVAVVCVVALVYRRTGAYTPPPLAFDGTSDQLKQTVIVPTLDTPMPAGKNVIWCASFQLAWNEFKNDVIGEPVKITDAQEIADRLNASMITTAVLEPGDYYAKAGYVEAGAVERIEREMSTRFPDVALPKIGVGHPDPVAVAFAYLQVSVKFSQIFDENRDSFLFRGVPVTSFGIRENGKKPDDPARGQVLILYSSEDMDEPWSDENEFILDLSSGTEPYEIILARVDPRSSLAETVAAVDLGMETGRSNYSRRLEHQDVLLVPNLHWKVEHHFKEIEGSDKPLQNEGHGGNWLDPAWQMIEFKLDRAGAVLRSEATIKEVPGEVEPRRFVFDRPFLILMRKRQEGKHPSEYTTAPFFVMWVDNAELLCKP